MDHFISLQTASDMTALYRANREQILKQSMQGQDILPVCETFDRAAFDTLLAKPDCKGLRIYFGMSEELKVHTIIVAVNSNDEDILPSATLDGDDDDDILEKGNRCPPTCPPDSPLNN
jgi:hypothetical protein